jgi:hypothetical protein
LAQRFLKSALHQKRVTTRRQSATEGLFRAGAHSPGRLVTASAENPLQTPGAHAVLLAGDLPHGAEPDRQRYVTVLKDGPCGDRHLIPAMAAKPTRPPNRPGIGSSASWADTYPPGQRNAARYST